MPKIGDHAVVLGASMGGLLAARALTDFYHRVTVVERDALPDNPAQRRGVPQGRHAHALLARGAEALEDFFPGILDELVAAGAPMWSDGDMSRFRMRFLGHDLVRDVVMPRDENPRNLYLPSRPLVEGTVRQRLRALPEVTIIDGHDVVELTTTPDDTRVTGVRVIDRSSGETTEFTADLVVDALGRGAHTPAFLEAHGYPRPAEEHIAMRINYVSQWLRIPQGALHELLVNIGPAPDRPTGLVMSQCENGTCVLTVYGMAGAEPPADFTGMLSYAADYAPAELLTVLRDAEPIGEVIRARMPSSQWRHYHKLRQFPEGLLVSGDAICSFNPIYGQGMTVSALDATVLRDCLRRGTKDLSRRYFRATAKMITVPWRMNAGADLIFAAVEGKRTLTMRLSNRFSDRVLAAAESDAVAVARFLNVTGLILPPTSLLNPAFLCRVVAVNIRSRRTRPDSGGSDHSGAASWNSISAATVSTASARAVSRPLAEEAERTA